MLTSKHPEWNLSHQKVMPHALKNYSRVSTSIFKIIFKDFQGIIFSRARYTIMHVGILKIMIPPVKTCDLNARINKALINEGVPPQIVMIVAIY